MTVMRIALAQLPDAVGDLGGNAERILDAMRWAEGEEADVLVLPELALTGYPLSDLALHDEFVRAASDTVGRLAAASGDTVTLLGTIERVPPQRTWDSRPRDVTISSVLLSGGEVRGSYHKVLLPTHGGYDEGRTFASGRRPDALWRVGDVVTGVVICEDLWSGDGPPEAQAAAGARIILAPNASPYWRGKAASRRRLVERVARRNGVPLVYVNLVGGQDELVFDGGSLVADRHGRLVFRAPEFCEHRAVVDLEVAPPPRVTAPVSTVHTRPLPAREAAAPPSTEPLETVAGVWHALVRGTRDFARRNGNGTAVLAMSGGIDALVTAAVAADALGPEQVLGVAMPDNDTPGRERRDAEQAARALGMAFEVVPVDDVAKALRAGLARHGAAEPETDTERRLHARARAALLWAIADEDDRVVLATANKSELSAGGATIYGDVAGTFAPLRDCPKTLLYDLARHRNALGAVIPEAVLEAPTTAERSGDWPAPYEVLDEIVERYVEHGDGVEELVAAGFDPDTTVEIVRRVDDAELARRLAPPGVKVTARAFDLDRRMPISNAWRARRDGLGGLGDRDWRGVEEEG